MKRGDLSNQPMPRIHVEWRVVFVDPGHGARWRPYAWKTLLWFAGRWPLLPGLHHALAGMVRTKRAMPQWLSMTGQRFQVDIVVIGPKPLWRAVRKVIDENELWIGTVYGFLNWNEYYLMARAERALVEFITPADHAVPGSLAVHQRPYEGWGHRPEHNIY